MTRQPNHLNRAVFLDRDGTINVDRGNHNCHLANFEFLPEAVEGLKHLSTTDYKLIIITNQSKIGRGIQTPGEYQEITDYMLRHLKQRKIRIEAVYHCPHLSEDNCECRKPKSGMLEKAAEDFAIDLEQSWMIGDSTRDIECGENAGCKTILISQQTTKQSTAENPIAENLIKAAEIILKNA